MTRRTRNGRGQAGFTILEMMVAASVFTIILLIVAVGVISFTNSYYKGINSSKTQSTARAIMAALTQSIQFGKSVSTSGAAGGVQGLCIDNTLYSYVVGQEVVDSNPQAAQHQAYHGLVVTTGSSCSGVAPVLPTTPVLSGSDRELLGAHMRLGDLSVTPVGSLYTVHLKVIYGEDDLLTPAVTSGTNWAAENCAGGQAGGQFCAVSDLTTTVERRLL